MLKAVRRHDPGVERYLTSRRVQLAFKGALAAAAAWLLAEAVTRLFGSGGLDDYIYYAPLGAVVATDATIAGSARIARQSAFGLALGAALGLAVGRTLDPSVFSLAFVVAAGVLLGAVPGLGEMRSWVPIVALFVLVLGGHDAETYATAYVGLTALGAGCGVVVNLLLPSMPLRSGQEALDRLKSQLAHQLNDLADGLRQQPPPGREGWSRRRWDTQTSLDDSRAVVRELMEAQYGNIHRARHQGWVDKQTQLVGALEHVAWFVEDLLAVLSQNYREDVDSPMDPELAEVVASAIDELAVLVLAYDDSLSSDDDRVRSVEKCLKRLTREFADRRDLDAAHVAILGTVVVNLRRATSAVHPGVERAPV
ncbi:MAG TPA: hypothetical protein VFG72_08915 [Marmoricola sp.]|nr:hypothetical protein [Marmoricola sp.]